MGIHVAAETTAHCKPATDTKGWMDVDPAPGIFFSTDYPPSGPAGDLQCTTRLESDTRQEVLRNLIGVMPTADPMGSQPWGRKSDPMGVKTPWGFSRGVPQKKNY